MIAEPMPDFEQLRFSTRPLDALAARPSKPPRHRQGEAFLKGPIPMAWLALAARLPGRALHMGLVLWYWAGITKQRVVAPSLSRAEREFGVSRTALARGLAALEHADLVSVDRRAGRKPVVTLLDPPRSRKTSGNIGSEPKVLVPSDLSAPDVRPDVGENIGTHREPSDRSADQIDEFP